MSKTTSPFFAGPKTGPLPTTDLLSWMFDNQPYDCDKKIYIDASDTTRFITSAIAKNIIRKLAKGLRDAGLNKGDCVLVHAFNDIYYSMLVLGIVAAGGVFTATNPAYTAREMEHHIKSASAQFIFTEPEMLPTVLEVANKSDVNIRDIWIFHPLKDQKVPAGQKSWEELLTKGESDWVRFDDEKLARETTAFRLFSSGTTGLPKAVDISHLNLMAQHVAVSEFIPKPYEPVSIIPLPMFHVACVPHAHVVLLRAGRTAYILRRFHLELYLSTVEKHGINELGLVPPLAVLLVMSPLTKKYSLRNIKTVLIGAAPLSKDIQARLKNTVNPDKNPLVNQVWGMTESTCIATMFHNMEDDDTGSVGRLLPNLEAKLIDDAGNDISAYDTPGEICLRGPTMIKGYYNNDAANRESYDSDGFYHTGDIGLCDGKTKKWYIVDRKKELIKVRGFQVAPPELEGILLEHPHIIDAAVIGVVTETHGSELPRAYIVRRPGSKLEKQEVKEYVKAKVASYKRLEGGVVFLDAIPKNASGKILKNALRELARKEMGAVKAKL
ncbi:uncharacterized protein H6S33_006570 [Morchella sextelata]|uniref:uncharacterized protein n=1 Tax=Morchella sextelata TaxID=1174677 RepID=UPI001D03E9A0|nr:uncharacterized protein H6S33_006570 [Morchella sextelata]KAH0604902.1 hypothetical protein H6S33_006570 [Morchella sextelata]